MNTTKYFVTTLYFAPLLFALLLFSGCKPSLLPGTNVKDTRENREIVHFLEKYKEAVEKRSVDAIMDLVAKDYSDNMGSENPEDYVSYITLKDLLQRFFPRIKDIRLAMVVQHIAKIEPNVYEVVFYFNKQLLAELPSSEKWESVKEVNRMVIRRTEKGSPNQFEILSGI